MHIKCGTRYDLGERYNMSTKASVLWKGWMGAEPNAFP